MSKQLVLRAPRRLPALPALGLWGVVAAVVYGVLLAQVPLLANYTARLKNINDIPKEQWPLGLLAVGAILLLFLGYALGARGVGALAQQRSGRLLIVAFPLLFAALLVAAYPLTSTDVYDYLFRGRILARYGANPFTTPPQTFGDDPLLPYVAWKLVVTAYGPLWESMSFIVARLAGERPGAPLEPAMPQLLRLIIGYKALAVVGFLFCAGAIWVALRDAPPEQRWLGVYLWLWNPLALWETVGAAHNDAWMAGMIVLALASLRQPTAALHTGAETSRRREPLLLGSLSALLFLTAGGLIKFVAFFFGPLALLAALRRTPGWRGRALLFVLGGAMCLILVATAYAPFWEGFQTLSNISERRGLYNASWLAAGRALLLLAVPEERANTIAALGSLALLGLGILWCSWRAWRKPAHLDALVLGLVLWFLFVCNPWFLPWYTVWPLALVAIQPWRSRMLLVVGLLSCTALIHYLADGLLLPALGLPDKSWSREGALAVIIYGPPLVVLFGPAVAARVRRWRGRKVVAL